MSQTISKTLAAMLVLHRITLTNSRFRYNTAANVVYFRLDHEHVFLRHHRRTTCGIEVVVGRGQIDNDIVCKMSLCKRRICYNFIVFLVHMRSCVVGKFKCEIPLTIFVHHF